MPGLEKLKEDVAVMHTSFDLSGSVSSFADENEKPSSRFKSSSDYRLFSKYKSSSNNNNTCTGNRGGAELITNGNRGGGGKSTFGNKSKLVDDDSKNNIIKGSGAAKTASTGGGGGGSFSNGSTATTKSKPFAKKQKSASSLNVSLSSSMNGFNDVEQNKFAGADSFSNRAQGSKLGFKKKSTSNAKNKDDPFRFAGDGVDFKCKLIGFQEVDQARGDQMCQDAIQACKAVVKRKGEHKQRIIFNISLEGLKFKDAATNVILHSFPVSKVSFIAKDVADNRAFGFVYSVSDHEHQFYAIKTEKTADSVVFSIRDMFQIAYEMKKKQVEQAKQLQTQKNAQEVIKCKAISEEQTSYADDTVPEANLLDLETELENLEQGMQNMDKWIVPSDGDGFFVENGVAGSAHFSSPADTTISSSTWATTSMSSSSAFAESTSDPFAPGDQIFTSSMNSFTSSFGNANGSLNKEPLVPPPPSTNGHARRSSSGARRITRSTLFGPPPTLSLVNGVTVAAPPTSADPFGATFDFPTAAAAAENHHTLQLDDHRSSLLTSSAFTAGGQSAAPNAASDPFDTSHVMNLLAATNNTNATPAQNSALNPLRANPFDSLTPQVSSTPVPNDVVGSCWPASGAPAVAFGRPSATPATLTKEAASTTAAAGGVESFTPVTNGLQHNGQSPAADFHQSLVGRWAVDSAAAGRRFPSAIPPPPNGGHNATTQQSPPLAFDDFSSPDRSVFSASGQQSMVPSGYSSTFNSALMNQTINSSSAFGISNLTADTNSSSVDWVAANNVDKVAPNYFPCKTAAFDPFDTKNEGSNHSSSSRSSPALTTNGYTVLLNNNNGYLSGDCFQSTPSHNNYNNNNSNFSTTTIKNDPFAHLKQKPVKKTINQLRGEMNSTAPNVDQLELIVNGNGKNVNGVNPTCRSTILPAPLIPPRIAPPIVASATTNPSSRLSSLSAAAGPTTTTTKALRRPSASLANDLSNGLVLSPPPRIERATKGGACAAVNHVSNNNFNDNFGAKKKSDDPFADEFFA